jgi:hypothetical protein
MDDASRDRVMMKNSTVLVMGGGGGLGEIKNEETRVNVVIRQTAGVGI